MAQGLSTKQRATALWSFKAAVLEALGIKEGNYYEEGSEIVYGKALFPELGELPLNIEITENFTPNPFVKDQEPKSNPVTGEIIMFSGKSVYRHTELVARSVKNSVMTEELAKTLLQEDNTSKTVAVSVEKTEEVFA